MAVRLTASLTNPLISMSYSARSTRASVNNLRFVEPNLSESLNLKTLRSYHYLYWSNKKCYHKFVTAMSYQHPQNIIPENEARRLEALERY